MMEKLGSGASASDHLKSRIGKANNAENLLEATLRAISERRSNRLDEISATSIRMEARCAKAEVDHLKAETAAQVYRTCLAKQAQLVCALSGLTARCVVFMDAGVAALNQSEGAQSTIDDLRDAASTCRNTLSDLLGATLEWTEGKAPVTRRSSVSPLSNGDRSMSVSASKSKSGRSSVVVPSPRKTSKSPRKSLRTSLSRVAKTQIKRAHDAERKIVRWKDEEETAICHAISNTPNHSSPVARSVGANSSESDWEDEKTEESVRLTSTSSRRMSLSQRRPRNSRLDPSFLKPHSVPLESLKEVDETKKLAPQFETAILEVEERGKIPLPKARGIGGERRAPSQLFAANPRRSSAIGPVRSSRSRRRSSILQDHPNENGRHFSSARRVAVSENRSPVGGSKPPGVPASGGSMRGVLLASTNIVESIGDSSFKTGKPLWR